jgi:putative endopeptidase
MNKKLLAAIAAGMIMMTACDKQKPLSTGIHLENLDTTVCAQTDFYQYATGGWQRANPLQDEYARFGSFDKLGLECLEQVNTLVQELAKEEHQRGSIEQKIGDVYNLAMDTARRNREDIEPIRASIEAIDAIKDRSELSKLLGESMEYGLWSMYVDADAMNSSMNILNEYQGGFALGQRDYYLDEDEHTQMIRAEYLKHIRWLCRDTYALHQ